MRHEQEIAEAEDAFITNHDAPSDRVNSQDFTGADRADAHAFHMHGKAVPQQSM